MKHYNFGNVRGKVKEVEKKSYESGATGLRLKIDCSNSLYGNVWAYGWLWGEKIVSTFLENYKESGKDSIYRFTGNFSQNCNDDGKMYNSFSFWKWMVDEEAEVRACFVLTGGVTEVYGEGTERVLCMMLERENKEDQEFRLPFFSKEESTSVGEIVKIEGILRAREGESFFGELGRDVRPYVMSLERK